MHAGYNSPSVNRKFFAVVFVFIGLLPLASFHVHAQFTKLLDFGSKDNGYLPYSAPITDGTFLYGMTSEGGSNDLGTIYKINTDGTGFTKLLDFDGTNGKTPLGSLLLIGSTLYGMTSGGGANGQGVIFKINTDGTGFTTLFDFNYTTTGAYPTGSLISDGTFLYGMTNQGGSPTAIGTVFKIMPDGTGYSKLLNFNGSNGSFPNGSLTLVGSSLYGMTRDGGASNLGIIFKINTDGTGFSNMMDFTGTTNGSSPLGSLISDGIFLYGMTRLGGASNFGTLFKIKTDGTGYVRLVNFDSFLRGGFPKGSLTFSADLTYLFGTTTNYGGNDRGVTFKVKTDGTGFFRMFDNDVGTNGPNPEGTLLLIGPSIYGVKSGGGSGTAPFPQGTIFKANTDGTTYVKLFSFDVEGSNPSGSLYSDGTFQYGTTSVGGQLNYGTIFKIKADGTGFTRLFNFSGVTDGKNPKGALISDGVFLYGMTSQGGANDAGIIFKIKPDGTNFTKLLDFSYSTSGGNPNGSLYFDGTFLYGMTASGGPSNYGNIFKIKPDGTGFANLFNFNDTNGSRPNGSVISDGVFLFGTTYQGGASGWGTVFKIKTDGTSFSTLLEFDNTTNGGNPEGDLIFDGTYLYGTTFNGAAGNGSIFKIKTDGTGYTKLKDFDSGGSYGSLISDGTSLYGMTNNGGSLGFGTIFKIKPDGTGYALLQEFNDGKYPYGSLILDGSFLYGMTSAGGKNNAGTMFQSSTTAFTSITDFFPTEGVEGTLVTINGNNFDPTPANNIVKFNGTTAVVKSGNATTLTAFVPSGATSGPISVTALGTGTSPNNFTVTPDAEMIDVTVKNCNVTFLPPTYAYFSTRGYQVTETFLPVNQSDKVKVTFSTFNVNGGDVLYVYDGPTTASPLLATLSGSTPPAPIIATGVGGELTFFYSWGDGTTDWVGNISCQSTSATITVTTQPSDFIACVGQTATFSAAATGTTNITYQWQYSSNTPPLSFTDIVNGGGYANANTSTLSVNTTGNFGIGRYRCKISGDLAPTVFTGHEGLFINPVPSAPTATGASGCPNTTITLNAAGGTNGQYRWYTVPTAGTAIAGQTNSSYSISTLTTTTTYYVAINNGSCESARTSVVATITTPNAPTAIGGQGCPNTLITLNASGGTNGQYRWYAVATGGTAIAGQTNSSYSISTLTATTTYYVAINNGICESTRTAVTATINVCNPPVITTKSLGTEIGGVITLDLTKQITTANLDIASLTIVKLPANATSASIDSKGILTINYTGKPFAGVETITIRACDTNGQCSQQDFEIDVAGDIIVYNALSPNGANPSFVIQYINLFPETKNNTVTVFDRWQNEVWRGSNYDNTGVVFKGVSDDGNDLPTGTYFYRIDFASGKKSRTGFISLKR